MSLASLTAYGGDAVLVRLLLETDVSLKALAARLKVSDVTLRKIYWAHTTRAQRVAAAGRKRHGKRSWTEAQLQFLRENKGRLSAGEIARQLGRSLASVYAACDVNGFCKHRPILGKAFELFLKDMHALGWSDQEIAAAHGCDRHAVADCRKRLGLAANGVYSEHFRNRVRVKTAEQLAAAGLPTIGWLRKEAFRKRAIAAGWPADIGPRAVQILNVLWTNGPMTRRELADAIGMPWKGSRQSLVSNDPEGTYLAHLMKRGLVVSLGRIKKGAGPGHSVCVYSLPLWIERKVS